MDKSASTNPITLNQRIIQDYLDCPRRFQYSAIDNLFWPSPISDRLEIIEHSTYIGNQFHLLCHQFFSGVSSENLEKTIQDNDLMNMWEVFLPYGKVLIAYQHYSEQLLSHLFCEQRLVAKFDLIVKDPSGKLIILDWKTSAKKPDPDDLNKRVQSFLYPFILYHSVTDLFDRQTVSPEQIEMHYFYPNSPDPHEIMPYSEQEHIKITSRLETIMSNIFNTIKERGEFELTDDIDQCKYCRFRSLCDRGKTPGSQAEYLLVEHEDLANENFDLGQIGEYEF